MTPAHIVNTCIFIIPCFLLLFVTFQINFQTSDWLKLTVGCILYLGVTFYGSSTYDNYADSPVKYMGIGIFTLVLGAILFQFISGYQLTQSIFTVAIAKCYAEHITFLSIYIYFLLFHGLPSYQTFQDSLISLILVITSFPAIYWYFKRKLRPSLDCTKGSTIWRHMWILPISNNMLYSLLFSPSISSYKKMPDASFYYVPPLWVFLTFATYVLITQVILISRENAALSEKLHISEELATAQHKQVEALQGQIELTSQQRHDLRHHLLALQALAEKKDFDGLSLYIQKYQNKLAKAPEQYCEHQTLNTLISYYKELADNYKIRMDCHIDTPGNLNIPDMDLCVIVSNLLENAIEACNRMKSENRNIRFCLSSHTESILTVIVENSYEGEIKRTGNAFISSKSKGRKGIGIASVLNVIEHYQGVSKFEYQDHVFKVSLLLKL